jgi:hypothetical protein
MNIAAKERKDHKDAVARGVGDSLHVISAFSAIFRG